MTYIICIKNCKVVSKTHLRAYTLASSLPRSLTGVPDLGDTKQLSDNSSTPIIRPGHQDPFRRRTQTNPPTVASMHLVLGPLELPISHHTTLKSNGRSQKPPILITFSSPKHNKKPSLARNAHTF